MWFRWKPEGKLVLLHKISKDACSILFFWGILRLSCVLRLFFYFSPPHFLLLSTLLFTAEDNSVESDDQQMLSKYCVFSGRCYLTEAQKAKVLALVKKIRPEIPVLVVEMKKSNVKQSGTLVRKFYHCTLYELLFFCTYVQFLFYLGKLVVLL